MGSVMIWSLSQGILSILKSSNSYTSFFTISLKNDPNSLCKMVSLFITKLDKNCFNLSSVKSILSCCVKFKKVL